MEEQGNQSGAILEHIRHFFPIFIAVTTFASFGLSYIYLMAFFSALDLPPSAYIDLNDVIRNSIWIAPLIAIYVLNIAFFASFRTPDNHSPKREMWLRLSVYLLIFGEGALGIIGVQNQSAQARQAVIFYEIIQTFLFIMTFELALKLPLKIEIGRIGEKIVKFSWVFYFLCIISICFSATMGVNDARSRINIKPQELLVHSKDPTQSAQSNTWLFTLNQGYLVQTPSGKKLLLSPKEDYVLTQP